MTRPSPACKIFLTPHPSQPQSSRPSGNGARAVAPGHGARPGECRARAENATLRDRIAELERSAALDSTTSSKPPASDGLRKKSGTQRRTRSQRGKSGRPSGGQHNKAVASNLLDQNFSAEAPNEKWAADISYIWTAQGWLYLAVMLDLYSRRVIGWAVALA